MTERRYDDAEVRRILELATEPGAATAGLVRREGLTLAELQAIAGEVGVTPEAVAEAALRIEARAMPERRSWGMPVGVGRVVPLPRAPTDREWDQLVAAFRTTFGAQGKVATLGETREWSNGNLHVCLEPTEGGVRLRFGSLKGDAAGLNALGGAVVGLGVLTFWATMLTDGLATASAAGLLLGASGAGILVANLIRLPRWAQRRRGQMESLAARAVALLQGPPR